MGVSEVAGAVQSTPAGVQNTKRARELYQYVRPDDLVQPHMARRGSTLDVYNEAVPNLSSALAPFCQLAALRCNVKKAMLNVMDRDVMYSLAEAMRTTSSGHDFVEDPIMMSCTSAPLKGRACELTLGVSRDANLRYPMFTVPDLSKSDFAHLSVVAGPPYYRFYAGTPIITRQGVNIGSLAVMDVEPRACLSQDEVDFLGKTADQVMTYLETNRQAIEGRRARRLAEGLEGFIAGRTSLQDDVPHAGSQRSSVKRKGTTYGIPVPPSVYATCSDTPTSPKPIGKTPSLRPKLSRESLNTDADTSETSQDGGQDRKKDIGTESISHAKTFARAANLLRESFGDLGEDGCVRFMSLKHQFDRKRTPTASTISNGSMSTPEPTSNGGTDGVSSVPAHQAETLASSSQALPLANMDDVTCSPDALDDSLLREMMQRYPAGRLWSWDDSFRQSSSEDDGIDEFGMKRPSQPRRKSHRSQVEVKALALAFPHTRQVLFAPIWDPSVGSCQTAVFVAASSDTCCLSVTADLSFLNSFCSTVIGECSRIDVMKADKQKSDFVGTISHEMRSPLHGILASREFLADTELTNFQESLVATIESCGRTLLDTINHVLDFSKVNSFQKHWQASNKRSKYNSKRKHHLGPGTSSKSLTHDAPPLLQLFAVTDISRVLEEVVDSLVLGQTFDSGIDITDVSRESRGRGTSSKKDLVFDDVQVVLDVQQADWTFLTQPGAVRRIILNLCGNALKYTSHGNITVCLDLKTGGSDDSDTMILKVADQGRGISEEFLKTKLYTPFAQENALAPGTGLGLSIVRSIVTMLGGTIDVKSRVGTGTMVEVTLPMKRPLPGQTSTMTTPHSGGTTSSSGSWADESVALLQTQWQGSRVSFYRRTPSLANESLHDILSKYVEDWYGLDFVDQEVMESSDVLIVEEEDLESFMNQVVGTPGRRPALIVLCSIASRHSAAYTKELEARISGAVSFVAKPVGPYKLAKSMLLTLQSVRKTRSRLVPGTVLASISERTTPATPMQLADSRLESTVADLREMDLNKAGEHNPKQVIQATETLAVSQTSQNALMAINPLVSPTSNSRNSTSVEVEVDAAFPFPHQTSGRQRTEEGPAPQRHRASTSSIPNKETALVNPRVLLVDDNKINLKLLQTYLKTKRKYTRIDLAEDGQQAVDFFTSSASDPHEIVFMDISMPIMNGFEATRAIRDFEERSNSPGKTGAMIIALTGLASGKDQAEGFDAGVDIYLTKPVSFKEVSRFLDNWEGQQNMKDVGVEGMDFEDRVAGGVLVSREDARGAISGIA